MYFDLSLKFFTTTLQNMLFQRSYKTEENCRYTKEKLNGYSKLALIALFSKKELKWNEDKTCKYTWCLKGKLTALDCRVWVFWMANRSFQSVSPSSWSVRIKQEPVFSVVRRNTMSAGTLWSCVNITAQLMIKWNLLIILQFYCYIYLVYRKNSDNKHFSVFNMIVLMFLRFVSTLALTRKGAYDLSGLSKDRKNVIIPI